MDVPPPTSPYARLQGLLAIRESQRTDAQWDEIHELEIKLSSANRQQPPDQVARRDTAAIPTAHPNPSGGAQSKKPFHKVHNKKRPR